MIGGIALPRRLGTRPMWALVVLVPALLGIALPAQPKVLALVLVPILVFIAGFFLGPARWTVILAALAAGMLGGPFTNGTKFGGSNLWLSDFLVFGAIAGFAVEWLLRPPHERPRLPRIGVMGLPILLFGITIFMGAYRGHVRYGATLIGMPLRLVIYAGVIFALSGLSPKKALKGLTIVMYAGAVELALVAAYHIATGTSATSHLDLSTGGIRYIGIAAATYAASAFALAILNLSQRPRHPLLHLGAAVIAGFDVIVAYTRTIWLVLTVIVVVGVLFSVPLRRALIGSIPLVLPILLFGVLVVIDMSPNLVSTLTERVSTPAGQDTSVQWRAHAYQAVLSGTKEEPVRGIGFGRVTTFTINSQPNTITGDPHNGFIYVFAGSGLLGLGSLILVLLTSVVATARRWRQSRDEARTMLAWCFCTWLIIVAHSASEPLFTSPSVILVLWITMLLPAIVPLRPAERRIPAPALAPAAPRRALAAR